jgi:hypothetical protein
VSVREARKIKFVVAEGTRADESRPIKARKEGKERKRKEEKREIK